MSHVALLVFLVVSVTSHAKNLAPQTADEHSLAGPSTRFESVSLQCLPPAIEVGSVAPEIRCAKTKQREQEISLPYALNSSRTLFTTLPVQCNVNVVCHPAYDLEINPLRTQSNGAYCKSEFNAAAAGELDTICELPSEKKAAFSRSFPVKMSPADVQDNRRFYNLYVELAKYLELPPLPFVEQKDYWAEVNQIVKDLQRTKEMSKAVYNIFRRFLNLVCIYDMPHKIKADIDATCAADDSFPTSFPVSVPCCASPTGADRSSDTPTK